MSNVHALNPVLLALISVCFLTLTMPAAAATGGADKITLTAKSEVQLTNAEMEGNRGAAGVTINSLASTQTLAASSFGNSFTVGGDVTNGNVYLGDNFSGMGSYVMNTGNNSTINSAVSMNIQILPSSP